MNVCCKRNPNILPESSPKFPLEHGMILSAPPVSPQAHPLTVLFVLPVSLP